MFRKFLADTVWVVCLLAVLANARGQIVRADGPVVPAQDNHVFLPLVIKNGSGGAGNCQVANLLQDGSFETGFPYWSQLAGQYPIIQTFSNPLDGAKVAWFGGYNNADDRLAQTFTVPSGCTTVKIVVHLNLYTAETLNQPYDKLYASLQPTSGVTNPEVLVADNTDNCATCAWARYTYVYNQIPNPGQPLRLYFRGTTDVSNITNFRLDLVSIEASDTPFTQATTTFQTADDGTQRFQLEATVDVEAPDLAASEQK